MNLKKAIAGVCLGVLLLTGGCGQNQSNTQQKQDTTEQNKTQSQEAAVAQTEASSENGDAEGQSQAEASRDIFAMDTYMSVTAFGENADAAVDAAQAEIERLDAMLSTGNGDS